MLCRNEYSEEKSLTLGDNPEKQDVCRCLSELFVGLVKMEIKRVSEIVRKPFINLSSVRET